jgi:dTDP-4-dehydrorhamnose reductase
VNRVPGDDEVWVQVVALGLALAAAYDEDVAAHVAANDDVVAAAAAVAVVEDVVEDVVVVAAAVAAASCAIAAVEISAAPRNGANRGGNWRIP